ncbi:adenine phosphoribosyltransferase [bacterium]|nr:adenine phosphoribosyltransferase [bacterium]
MTITLEGYEYLKEHIRQVPDFPKPGILFLDITTATKDAKSMQLMTDFLYEKFKNEHVDYIAGVESRGFIFGAALAYKLGAGFIPIRKPNKLPAKTIKESYSLEYGTDTIEMHADALKSGDRVVVIDDLLATGGTAVAACNLCRKAGAEVVASAFIIELDSLKGREKLEKNGIKVISMLNYNLD